MAKVGSCASAAAWAALHCLCRCVLACFVVCHSAIALCSVQAAHADFGFIWFWNQHVLGVSWCVPCESKLLQSDSITALTSKLCPSRYSLFRVQHRFEAQFTCRQLLAKVNSWSQSLSLSLSSRWRTKMVMLMFILHFYYLFFLLLCRF